MQSTLSVSTFDLPTAVAVTVWPTRLHHINVKLLTPSAVLYKILSSDDGDDMPLSLFYAGLYLLGSRGLTCVHQCTRIANPEDEKIDCNIFSSLTINWEKELSTIYTTCRQTDRIPNRRSVLWNWALQYTWYTGLNLPGSNLIVRTSPVYSYTLSNDPATKSWCTRHQ